MFYVYIYIIYNHLFILACPKGTYRTANSNSSNCTACPSNTRRDREAAAQCQCSRDYFRNVPHEGPEVGCTRK